MKNMLCQNFIRCGFTGWCMECAFTGIKSLMITHEKKLTCTTSLWMFPIYGFACFIGPVYRLLSHKPLIIRVIIYILSIFSGEFLSGSLLKKYNMCPWDYSKAKYNFKGLIRLDYAPLWGLAGLFFEKINRADQ